jgi:small subunit ribosomal protein S11
MTPTPNPTPTSTPDQRFTHTVRRDFEEEVMKRVQSAPGGLDELAGLLDRSSSPTAARTSQRSGFDYDASASSPFAQRDDEIPLPPHHLHIMAHKHNTHITLTKPNRDPIISISCGNLGIKNSPRGSFDSAYQLVAYMMNRIKEQGLIREINQLEVVLRGFGQGRVAIQKALLGQEGRGLREKVVRITDATRLKFGGTRSPQPRRLG